MRRNTSQPLVQALHSRIPNPPVEFIGRQKELDWLNHRQTSSTPLTLIEGPAGVGKSALLYHWLHRKFEHDINHRALYIELQPSSTFDGLCCQIARSINVSDDDEHHIANFDRAKPALAYAIDIADTYQLHIVLDHAHRVESHHIVELTNNINQYARRAHWLIISRDRYRELVKQSIYLRNLSRPHTLELLSSWIEAQPFGQNTPQDILARFDASQPHDASMSLWTLERYVWGHVNDIQSPQTDTYSKPQQATLDLLEQTWRPIPLTFVMAKTQISNDEIQQLKQHHIIRQTHAGIILAEHHRTALESSRSHQHVEASREMVSAMAASGHLGLLLESIRLAIKYQMYDLIQSTLNQHFESLRRMGYLPDIYGYLHDVDDPKLSSWLFRCACYMARFEQAVHLKEVTQLDLEDANYWLYLLLIQGRYQELIELADGYIQLAEPQDKHLTQMYLTVARAQIHQGALQEALHTLDKITSEDVWIQLRIEFIRFNALSQLGQQAQCDQKLIEIRQQFEQLNRTQQRFWSNFLIHSYYRHKQYRQAYQLTNRFFDNPSHPTLVRGTEWILFAAVWVDAGAFDKANRAIKHALHYFADAPGSLSMTINIALVEALARGQWDEINHLIAQFKLLPKAKTTPLTQAEHEVILHQIRWQVGQSMPIPNETPLVQEHGYIDAVVRGARETTLRRAGLPIPQQAPLQVSNHDDLDYIVHQAYFDAIKGVLSGDNPLPMLADCIHIAQQKHARRFELELRATYLLIAWILQSSDFSFACEQLIDLAVASHAPRYNEMGHFFAQLLNPFIPELDLWHAQHKACLVSHRVGASIFGEHQHLDAVEAEVVQTFTQKHDLSISTRHHADGPTWGIDAREGMIWHIDNGQLQYATMETKTTPFQLLCNMARHHHPNNKETLILTTWPEIESYHPLHHDNRLRLAVKRLRKALKSHLGDQQWLVTTEDGYCLNGTVRWIEHPSMHAVIQ